MSYVVAPRIAAAGRLKKQYMTSRLPILLSLGAIGCLSVMDALIKTLAPHYPTTEIVFLRYAAGSVFSVLTVAIIRPGWPRRETVTANASRSLVGIVTAMTFFYALGQLPLAETIALSFISPIFMVIFGALFLKEQVTRRILAALCCGMAGMIVIVSGQLGGSAAGDNAVIGVVAVLVSALTYALGIILLRARAQRDPMTLIVLFQNVFPLFLILPFAIWQWQPPQPDDFLLMVVIGILGTAGHLLFANAFARAPAATLAPLEYTALLWASGLGALMFGEVPAVTTLAGACLIIAGAVIAARRRRA